MGGIDGNEGIGGHASAATGESVRNPEHGNLPINESAATILAHR